MLARESSLSETWSDPLLSPENCADAERAFSTMGRLGGIYRSTSGIACQRLQPKTNKRIDHLAQIPTRGRRSGTLKCRQPGSASEQPRIVPGPLLQGLITSAGHDNEGRMCR